MKCFGNVMAFKILWNFLETWHSKHEMFQKRHMFKTFFGHLTPVCCALSQLYPVVLDGLGIHFIAQCRNVVCRVVMNKPAHSPCYWSDGNATKCHFCADRSRIHSTIVRTHPAAIHCPHSRLERDVLHKTISYSFLISITNKYFVLAHSYSHV